MPMPDTPDHTSTDAEHSGGSADTDSVGVHHRTLIGDSTGAPTAQLVRIIADLKGVDDDDLDQLYSWVDSLVTDLYSSPPPAAAQATVEFTYEGYRVTLYQDGHAVFTDRSIE